MEEVLVRGGEPGGRNVPLPKGNTYCCPYASSLVYSCMSPVTYPLLPPRHSFLSSVWHMGRMRPLVTVLFRGSRMVGAQPPQPRVLGFVPHYPLV
jgi:hypothetical protein